MYRNKLVLLFSLCLFFISGYGQKAYYVSTLAGDTSNISKGADSNSGYRDGLATYALFNGPTGIAVDTMGNIYVADTYNNVIRKINTLFNTVTTIGGDTADIKKGLDSNLGYMNGSAFNAKFSNPLGVCVDKYGNVYVADTYNNVIRKISTTGTVTTYAGKDSAGMTFAGYVNGSSDSAEFFTPTSLTVDTAGNIYVADNGNNAIREIVKSTGKVITLAGKGFDTSGYMNGPIDTAEFYSLYGILRANNGAIYVSQFDNGVNGIRRLYNDTVTTFAGFDVEGFGLLLSTETGYRDGKPDSVGTYADTMVLFNDPTGIAFDTAGNILVADEYNNVIRLVNTKDSVVSTLAGNHYNDTVQFLNGWFDSAVFYNPMGVAADKNGNIYVADLGNNLIRKIALRTVTGVPSLKKPLNTLSIYPNPCTDRLNIVATFNGKADLLDVTGRIIWTDNNFKSPYTLSTSAITAGVYFLRVTSQTETLVKKIEVVR